VCGCVKGAIVCADRVHLVGDDAARQLVVELERFDRAASLELVEAVADAVHRAAEGVVELPRVAVVVAVGEQEVLGLVVTRSRSFGWEPIPKTCPQTRAGFQCGQLPSTEKGLLPGPLLKPSDGLEPSTPSLPCRGGRNWWQSSAADRK
jgi:hypothetical protein